MPGVLKNGIDWLTRPAADIERVFGDRPVAVIGASPGGFGTILSQNAWLPVLRTLGTRPWFGGRLMVSRAGQVFNEAGELVDEKVKASCSGACRASWRLCSVSVVPREFGITAAHFRSTLVGKAGGRGGPFSGHARGRLPGRACVVASTPLHQRRLWGNRDWPCARPAPTTDL